jgi:hypothetical protein
MFTGVIRGQLRPLHAVVLSWNHMIFFLKADESMQRIFCLRVMLHADGDPSVVVLGVNDGGRISRSFQSYSRDSIAF